MALAQPKRFLPAQAVLISPITATLDAIVPENQNLGMLQLLRARAAARGGVKLQAGRSYMYSHLLLLLYWIDTAMPIALSLFARYLCFRL